MRNTKTNLFIIKGDLIMRKLENKGVVQGKIYDHSLEIKQVQKKGDNFGKDFIMGELRIQVGDKDSMRIIPVRYGYTPPVYNSGKENKNFYLLKQIIEEGKTVVEDGWENAWYVEANIELETDDGYDIQADEMRTYQRNRGSFLRIYANDSRFKNSDDERCHFSADVIISKVRELEEDEEEGRPHKAILSCAVFNFKNEYMPFEMVCYNEGGIDYFVNMDINSSNPLFTKVAGFINNSQIKTIKTEESAFGEAMVTESVKTVREWVINWCRPESYEIDGEDITSEEIKTMLANRETHLAEVKQNRLEYEAQKREGGLGVSAFDSPANTVQAGASPFKF